MRILIIGGTAFVGRAIAAEAIARGHDVTLFHRGQHPARGLDGAHEILGDRDGDLAVLQNGRWDATIDVCAYRPSQVRSLAAALDGHGGQPVFISTVSVYADDVPPGSDESALFAPLTSLDGVDTATCPIDGRTYGPLKVLCESAVDEVYGSTALVIRPTYVIGPHDHTDRFPQWVRAIAGGGVVEVPEVRDVAFQYVDARDLAAFTVSLTEQGAAGAFHVAAPAITFAEMIDTVARTVGPKGLELRSVPATDTDAESGRFPLWSGLRSEPVLQMDPAAAFAAGLVCRPLADSARDTLTWLLPDATEPPESIVALRNEVRDLLAYVRGRDDELRAARVAQAQAGALRGYEGLAGFEAERVLLERERHALGQASAGYAVKLAMTRVVLREAEEKRTGHRQPVVPLSGRVHLPDVPCRSVFDSSSATQGHVQIGQLQIPVARVENVSYFPDVAMPVTAEGYVPLESMEWPDIHEYWIESEAAVTVDLDAVTELDEDVCILSNIFSMTFGHWLTEELVSLYLHEAAGFTGKYVTYDRWGEGLPAFIPESLELLGIPPERVITSLDGPTRFRSITYTPVVTHDLSASYPDVYLGYRQWVLNAAGVPEPSGGRRVWLSRDQRLSGARSGLVNGTAVMELIERHGFEIVDPGALSFADQIRLISQTSVWAGAHGSATRHCLFMPLGSSVIECFSPYLPNKTNMAYFRMLKHNYDMIMMESAYEDYPWGVDMFVDVEHLALALERLDERV